MAPYSVGERIERTVIHNVLNAFQNRQIKHELKNKNTLIVDSKA